MDVVSLNIPHLSLCKVSVVVALSERPNYTPTFLMDEDMMIFIKVKSILHLIGNVNKSKPAHTGKDSCFPFACSFT